MFNFLLKKYYKNKKHVETCYKTLIETQDQFKKLLPPTSGGDYDKNILEEGFLKKLRKDVETAIRRAKTNYKESQREMQKSFDDLLNFRKNELHWFVATIRVEYQEVPDFIKEKKGLPESYKHISTDSRCWGFFHSLEDAVKRVESNATDMNEAGYYAYAVIEPKQEGLCDFQDQNLTLWFEAVYENNKCIGYRKCEQPEWAKNTAGWTIS